MTIPTISCEQFVEKLADYLESSATDGSRGPIEGHAASCAECGALLNDLRQLRIDAAALPPRVPERDLWAGIAARIETPVVEITPAGRLDSFTGRRERRMSRLWTGLAAAGLVAVTATVTHQLTKRSVSAGATPVAVTAPKSDTPTTTLVSNPPTQAEKTYDAEIARLRAVVAERRSMLDTTTINVIDRNLKIIDGAIEQCRQALVKDPASRFLMQSLNDALDTKLQLLRTAATLPSRA